MLGEGNSSNIIWSVVDGEAVMLDVATGHHYSLNPVATEIWQCLHDGLSVSDIVATIADKYGVEEEIVRRDLGGLMEELCAAGLWV
jgi:hypothetical protein